MVDWGLNLSIIDQPSDDDDSVRNPRSIATYSSGRGTCKPVKLEPRKSAGRRSVTMEFGSPKSTVTARGDMIVSNSSSSSKRKRGRPLGSKNKSQPPGSKNKPRPSVVIEKESEWGLKLVLIEISAGSDVVESLVHFAHENHVGISVLHCCGSVSVVTLRQHPSLSHHCGGAPPALSLHGSFDVLSLSGSFVENLTYSFGICLAGNGGEVFGGIIGGKVIAASLVVVVATTFVRPKFHKLSADGGVACDVDSDDHDDFIKPSLGTSSAVALLAAVHASAVASSSTCFLQPLQVTHDHQMAPVPWGAPPPPRPHYYNQPLM